MIDAVFVALCASAVFKYAVLVWGHRRIPETARHVGHVTAIWYYPVKSCRGLPLQHATCTPQGLRPLNSKILDRHFMVCNPADGSFITQRQVAFMSLITPRFHEVTGDLLLHAPGEPPLCIARELYENSTRVLQCRVWQDNVEGLYCGEEAEIWLTKLLHRPACLVLATANKRDLSTLNTDKWYSLTLPHDKVAFADFAPYLLTTDASLGDLNDKLSKPVPMENFRPNIAVDGVAPFDEDNWEEIFIGTLRFRNLKQCGRCVMTTIDRNQGIKDSDQEPLKTLKTYRIFSELDKSSPMFGVNIFADFHGDIEVGQAVFAISKASSLPSIHCF